MLAHALTPSRKMRPGPVSKIWGVSITVIFFFQNYIGNRFLYVIGVSIHYYGIILEFRVQITPLIIKKLYFWPF